jgi:hypothetical protein
MRSATSITLLASLTAEACRTRPYDRLRPAGHLELRKDVGDVVAHRVRRQAEPASNGGVAQPAGHISALAQRRRVSRCGRVTVRRDLDTVDDDGGPWEAHHLRQCLDYAVQAGSLRCSDITQPSTDRRHGLGWIPSSSIDRAFHEALQPDPDRVEGDGNCQRGEQRRTQSCLSREHFAEERDDGHLSADHPYGHEHIQHRPRQHEPDIEQLVSQDTHHDRQRNEGDRQDREDAVRQQRI